MTDSEYSMADISRERACDSEENDQGHLNVELNEAGRQQAVAVADKISKDPKLSAAYTCEVKRALEIAQIIDSTIKTQEEDNFDEVEDASENDDLKIYHDNDWELFAIVRSEEPVDVHMLMSYFWSRRTIILEKYKDHLQLAALANQMSNIYSETSFLFENMIARASTLDFEEQVPSTPAALAEYFHGLLNFISHEADVRGLPDPPRSMLSFIAMTLMDMYGNLTILMKRLAATENIQADVHEPGEQGHMGKGGSAC